MMMVLSERLIKENVKKKFNIPYENVLYQHELPSESGASVRKPWKAEVWGIVSGASSICPLGPNMKPPAFVDDISQKAEKRFRF